MSTSAVWLYSGGYLGPFHACVGFRIVISSVGDSTMTLGRALAVLALSAGAIPAAIAADANAGKTFFRAQCALCHSAEPNDNGGAQGPNLNGVFGRHSASTDFSYTKAMKDSRLTWDAATLDRFLNSPTTVVPGSAMVIPV